MHVPARGNESEAWIISADKFGKEAGLTYPGHTLIIAPDGTEVAHGSGDQQEIVYADIDLDEVRKVRARPDGILRGRRPETYGLLTKPYESLPYAKIAETPIVPGRLAVLTCALQVTNTTGDAPATLDVAVRTGWEAARENARLIVFPELFLCPAEPTPEMVYQSAVLTADALAAFGGIAKEWKAWYVLNLAEKDGDDYYHTAFIVGPDGKVLDRYRKVHLTAMEARWATPGNNYCVVELPFGNVGVMLGHEARYCEAARILTCMGADVIATPTTWRHQRESHLFLRERALENKIFVVAANRLDAPCPGDSKVILPNGAVASRAAHSAADYVFHYLNLAWSRDKQIRPGTDLIKNRRPQFYGPFTQPFQAVA